MTNTILHGDCIEKIRELPDNSVDSVVTDPPYELGFMGKSWDNTGIANSKEMWAEALRVLKPGGHLLAFSGTRTYHRMAVAIEDAGFEVRDMIEWVYGSGFPKSLNIGKSIENKMLTGNASKNGFHKLDGERREGRIGMYDTVEEQGFRKVNPDQLGAFDLEPTTDEAKLWNGWGTALKPAHEPICMARKPLAEKTVAENVLKYGTGGINIDISRISAYIDGDNSENIVLSHKLSELRGKLHTLLFSYEVGKKDCPIPSNDDGYVQKWKELQDCLGDCLACRGLYDELSPLFLKDDQVSVQQLHDALSRISHYQSKQSDTPCSQCKFRLSNLDDLNQLVLSYSNDTTLYIQKQELKTQKAKGSNGGEAYGDYNLDATYTPSTLGRFPANLIHDNSEEVRECFPETKSQGHFNSKVKMVGHTLYEGGFKDFEQEDRKMNDSGNASRFFKSVIYQAKASKSERNKGCEELEEKPKVFNGQSDKPSTEMKDVEKRFTTLPKANNHPTVKPIALMEYLIKMVTPKGGIVLDPFAGSGSTLVAAKQNGFQYIGIEMTEEYIPIIEARLK